MPLRFWIVKVHLYAGLITFSQVLVFAIAGITASLQSSLERPKLVRSTRYVTYRAMTNATDKEVARDVYESLRLPLARPMPDWFLQHDTAGNLKLDFYTINGIHRVTVLEKECRLRIEEIRNDLALFLQDIHAATGDGDAPLLVKVWAWLNVIAMWSLFGFCASGIYLWLTAYRRWWWAAGTLAVSCSCLIALYWSLR